VRLTRVSPYLRRVSATSLPPPVPSELAPDTFADRLYGMMRPLAGADGQTGYSLLILCNAIGIDYQLVEDWVRDVDPQTPGWSLLLDVNRCPPEALPWLAQFVGVRLLPGDPDDADRVRIASTAGFRRGTVAALTAAAAATLTGNKSVFLTERDHDPADTPDYAYYLSVVTYAGQTPDPGMTERALLAQKPGGIVLTYTVVDGQIYDQVRTRFATYADLRAGYPDYQAVWTDTPP
jgi:Phage tail protein (Tail_P2_I)